ncbi:MAG TPA: KTSC domain-containing protein [Bacteroidia bacterium]|nr:KTSC domain-containing protein [Bacteroidia bacterium]
MKRILENRKLLGVTHEADLAQLKTVYRNLMKEFHPDKFQDEALKAEAEIKSKTIIDAYHFLVSISPETHALNAEEYARTINTSGIDDFLYKGQTLKVTFQDGSVYEYFGVSKNIYNKLINSSTPARFARRHIFESCIYRKAAKQTETV